MSKRAIKQETDAGTYYWYFNPFNRQTKVGPFLTYEEALASYVDVLEKYTTFLKKVAK